MKKKIFVTLLSVIMICSLVFFVGCSKNNSDNASVKDDSNLNEKVPSDKLDANSQEDEMKDNDSTEAVTPVAPIYKDGLKYTFNAKTNTYTVTCDDQTITKATIADSIDGVKVATIADEAFKGCTALESVEIPSTVTSFSASAFKGCVALSNIDIDENNETYVVEDGCIIDIGSNALVLATSSEKIPDTVVRINKGSYNFPNATELIVPSSVKEIEMGAFSGCGNLEKIVLPFIGAHADADDTSLGLLGYVFGTEKYDNSVTQNYSNGIGIYYYIPKGLKEITVSGGVIGYGAFYNCSKVETINLGKDVTLIGESITNGCENLTSISVDSQNVNYLASGNCIVDKNTNTVIAGCNASTIPTDGSVQYIADKAFISCKKMTSISIPSSVVEIGPYAFADCTQLQNIVIGNGVVVVGKNAFRGCTSAKSVTFGNALKTIGDDAFAYCTSLTSVTISPNVEGIGSYAFEGCTSLTNVTIGSSVKGIGCRIFYDCISLTSVTVEGNTNFKKNTGYDGSGTMLTETTNFNDPKKNVDYFKEDTVWTRMQ